MSKRRNRRAKRNGAPRPAAPREPITLDQFAQTALAEYPKWQAVFVLATKPAERPDDDNEENGELSCKYRPGYDLRLMVAELRGAADMLEQTLNEDRAAGPDGEDEVCESCGAAPAVDFVTIELAITDDEAEQEAVSLCEGCSSVALEFRDKCHLAKTAKPEDGTAAGCALVELAPFYDDADDKIQAFVLCGTHAAELSEWLHSDD